LTGKQDTHVLSSTLIGKRPEDRIQAEYRQKMQAIAEVIDEFLNEPGRPKTTAFAMLLAPFGESARVNYISNAKREDMLQMMRDYLKQNGG